MHFRRGEEYRAYSNHIVLGFKQFRSTIELRIKEIYRPTGETNISFSHGIDINKLWL